MIGLGMGVVQGAVRGGLGPSLDLNFLTGALDPRLTFTRAGTGTYFDAAGVMQAAAANEPRFDHDPVTLKPRGLLIEGSRTNTVLHAQNFADGAWSKANSAVAANVVDGPSGGLSGSKLIESGVLNYHGIQQAFTTTTGTIHTTYFVVKAAERGFCFVGQNNAGNICFVSFDLSLGAASVVSGTPAGYGAIAFGNGWWLVWVAAAAGSDGNTTCEVRISTDGVWANRNYTGDGTSGIFLWHGQREFGANPTSPILTTTAAVTRAEETCFMAGANFLSWFNPNEGTVVSEVQHGALHNSRNYGLWNISPAGTYGSDVIGGFSGSGSGVVMAVNAAGVGQAYVVGGNFIPGTINRMASAYAASDFARSANGGTVLVDSSGVLPTGLARLDIGKLGATFEPLFGHVRRFTYFSRRRDNPSLRALARGEPTLDLNFESGRLDSRITFSRASTATYFGSDGLLKTAAVSEPRFDYDPVTKALKGLLIEPSRTNFIKQSLNMLASPWPTQGAPDGNLGGAPAFKISDNLADQFAPHAQNLSGVPVGPLAFTMRIKKDAAATASASFRFQIFDGVTNHLCGMAVNPATGEKFSSGWTARRNDYFVLDGGDHWLAVLLFTTVAGDTTNLLSIFPAHYDLAGVGGSQFMGSVTLAAPQLEPGTYWTSHIPTASAAVTRAADSVVMIGANFSTWFNQSAGAFAVEALRAANSTAGALIHAARSAVGYGPRHQIVASAVTSYAVVDDTNAAFVGGLVGGAIPPSGAIKAAFGYAYGGYATALNGGSPINQASNINPPSGLDMLTIGLDDALASHFGGHLKRVRFWELRITNDALQEISQ